MDAEPDPKSGGVAGVGCVWSSSTEDPAGAVRITSGARGGAVSKSTKGSSWDDAAARSWDAPATSDGVGASG